MNPDDNLTLFQKAAKAMQEAADGVVEEARRTGGEVVVWEDGAIRHIPASQLPPTNRTSGKSNRPCAK
jgi:hypothetical protein